MNTPIALGIDHGDARIGLAISDALGMFAHPLETVPARDADAALERVLKIIAERSPAVVVIGLPRNMDGSQGPAAEKVRAFGARLSGRAPQCTVRWIDERLTTVAAQKALQANGRNTKNSRGVIDQVSAQMILQTYLDGQAMQG